MMPRVLIIQPEKQTDRDIGKLFAERNCLVEQAHSLDEGRQMIEALPFDAVVLYPPSDDDLSHDSPVIGSDSSDNEYFSRFMKEHETMPPFILIGNSSQKWAHEKKLEHRIYGCLSLPVSDLDLSKIIQDLIDRRLLLEENMLLKERLKNLERHVSQFFTSLEDKVMRNTREIAEKKEVLQKIFNQIDGKIILVDKNHHVVHTSRGLVPGDYNDSAEECPGCRAMRTGRAVSVERTVLEKDRIRAIRQTAFPVFDRRVEESWGFVQFNQDITEEKAERDRLICLEKMETVEKLASFSLGILQSLAVTARATADGKKLRKKDTGFKDFLKVLDNQIDRVEDYIKDLLLVLNKVPAGDITLVNVNHLLQAVLSENRKAAGSEKIKIVLEPARDIPLVRVTRPQLARVFTHLIDNAFDSMQTATGGVMNELKIVTRVVDSEVEIEFSDTGPGIPDEIRDRIFEPFFTTKEERLGLGLSVCRSILEKYRGKLTLRQSQLKDRTNSFTISIPLL
ncbi:MAG: HAMP domain-containing sensor histidine kinase [bacterium]